MKGAKQTKLVLVTAPHFTAGFDLLEGVCKEPAPILSWVDGRKWSEVRQTLRRRGWKWEILE